MISDFMRSLSVNESIDIPLPKFRIGQRVRTKDNFIESVGLIVGFKYLSSLTRDNITTGWYYEIEPTEQWFISDGKMPKSLSKVEVVSEDYDKIEVIPF